VRTLLILAGLALLAVAGVAWFVYSGLYSIGATKQHTAPVYWLLNLAMRRSIANHAEGIRVPRLDDRTSIDAGLSLYRDYCVQCHGAPGVAPEPFALGLNPLPANLALTVREWDNPAHLYWAIRYGIKMSGMPAWEFRLTDAEIWSLVAFLQTLPNLSPVEYRAMTSAASVTGATPRAADNAVATSMPRYGVDDADAARGQVALQQYACVTCHVIPGVVAAVHPVGPSLAGIGRRKYLAGILPNTRETMIRWLREPQAVAPGTAMPDLGVTERDARDIAAFLETLE
jgi:mono/diheme cytochrome c family protein